MARRKLQSQEFSSILCLESLFLTAQAWRNERLSKVPLQDRWPIVKFHGVRWSFIWKQGMRNSTASPLFPDFKSDLSRVARFTTAGQEERRPWVRGWSSRANDWLCKFTCGHSRPQSPPFLLVTWSAKRRLWSQPLPDVRKFLISARACV